MARRRNPRGKGSRLREDIVDGAAALLEETGNEDSITLRGVARRVGIAAPSIYGHFADTNEIIDAVIARAFTELDQALEAAEKPAKDDERLASVCHAYVRFALEQPHRYRVMFGRHRADEGANLNQSRPVDHLSGADAFNRLITAVGVHTGTTPDTTTLRDATALWVALHGYVSLHTAVPAFPWPTETDMLTTLIERLVSRH